MKILATVAKSATVGLLWGLGIWLTAQEAPKPTPPTAVYNLDDKQILRYMDARREILTAQRTLDRIKEVAEANTKIQAAVKVINDVIAEARAKYKCPDCGFDPNELALVKTNTPVPTEAAKPAPEAKEQAKAVTK